MKSLLFYSCLSLACFGVYAQENHQHKPHTDKHEKQSANEHMHSYDTKTLIERFESRERDAYQKPDEVMRYLGKLKGKTVVDIGAGSGYFSLRLARAGAKVIAADVDDRFLNFLRERVEKEGLSQQIEVRKFPYERPELRKHEVDMVLLVNTYHHIDERIAYFSLLREAMKPGGALIVIDFFKIDLPVGPSVGHKLSVDEVVNELKAAGYHIEEVDVNTLPYQYIIKAR